MFLRRATRRDGWEVDGVGWRWIRRLFSWEEEQLIDCVKLLDNTFLKDNVNVKLIWKHDLLEGYSIEDVYHILTTTYQLLIDNHSNLIWSKAMPLKVSFFCLENN